MQIRFSFKIKIKYKQISRQTLLAFDCLWTLSYLPPTSREKSSLSKIRKWSGAVALPTNCSEVSSPVTNQFIKSFLLRLDNLELYRFLIIEQLELHEQSSSNRATVCVCVCVCNGILGQIPNCFTYIRYVSS